MQTGYIQSATPATDLAAAWDAVLTTSGWTFIHEQSAAVMGTTGAVRCYASATTTNTNGVYVGCILFVEVDDTNARLRIRCAEQYDSTLVATPSNNVRYPVPGTNLSAAITPTANYAVSESWLTLYQATGDTQSVGWVDVRVSTGGFTYWVGANAVRCVVWTNAGGYWDHCIAGHLDFMGVAGGQQAVFLLGGVSDQWVSWNSGAAVNVRVSREPLQAVAINGAFCYTVGTVHPIGGYGPTVGGTAAGHKWFYYPILYPAYLHGIGAGPSWRANCGCLSRLGEAAVLSLTSGTSGWHQPGSEVQAGATTYVSLGRTHRLNVSNNSYIGGAALYVRGDLF